MHIENAKVERLMRLYDGGIIVLIVVTFLVVAGLLSSRWLGDDNAIEEAAEYALESQTGIDLDLSPNSPE